MRTANCFSKTTLVQEFYRVWKVMGQQPSSNDLNRYGKVSSHYFKKSFGSWSAFLKKLKLEPLVYRPTNEELIDAYFRLKKELRRQPTPLDMELKGRFAKNTYRNRWGSWVNFLNVVGDKSLHGISYSEQELTQNYQMVREKLGYVPTLAELEKHGKFMAEQYYRTFGTYGDFLQMKEGTIQERLTKQYWAVKTKLGKRPTSAEYTREGRYSVYVVRAYFESWTQFLLVLGEELPRTVSFRTKKKLLRLAKTKATSAGSNR